MATFIDTLRFTIHDESRRGAVAAIARSPLAPRVRVLRFDDFDYDDCMMHFAHCGTFGNELAQLTALEELRVRGDRWSVGALPATLRTFVRESCTLSSEEVRELAAFEWPVLEHLELWFGNIDYGASATVADLAPILAGRRTPKLGHLGIRNSELAEPLLEALAKSPLLPRLHSLDLSMGNAGDDMVRALVAHAPRLRHLASIDLTDNFLTEDHTAEIRRVLDNVIVANQRYLDDELSGRYVAEHE